MTYKEYIYKLCTSADMDDKEDITNVMQILASECLKEHRLCMKSDDKLKEVLTAKAYEQWAEKTAKEIFKEEIEEMEDCDFKSFVLEHMELITAEGDGLYTMNLGKLGDDE